MEKIQITNNVKYIGVNDRELDLFESQFMLEHGMAYNSYVIRGEKNIVMDTVDARASKEWMDNLEMALEGEKVDYLVISHLEPDHSANIKVLADKYPEMKIVGDETIFRMLPQFFEIEDIENRKIVVKEAEEITLGENTLQFFMAPMVHWPEVMFTYLKNEKILFTADAFGKFGTLDAEEDWACEARRYYFGIVGKYGAQVQAILKKVAALDVQMICPLHGPILTENLAYYIQKYDVWSKYEPEEEGIMIAYASIHGNTEKAVKQLEKLIQQKTNKKVVVNNLVREDMAEIVEDAFRYDTMILAASSYNAEVFPPMQQFLHHLLSKNYQNRKVALIENGSWAPSAGKTMKNILQQMKDIDICNTMITIKTTMSEKNREEMDIMIEEILQS